MINKRWVHVALVTGAGQGIGAAVARALHAAGHAIAVADINMDRAMAIAHELNSNGRASAHAIEIDVRSQASVKTAIEDCTQFLGPPDILVNNAGLTRAKDFLALEADEWDEVLEVNLRGMFFTCQAVIPGMIEGKWGRIINLTSVSGMRGGPQVQGLHYSASKAGIIGLTRYLAYEFGPNGITVNGIAPGPIVTEAMALAPPDKVAVVAKQLPVQRLGEPKEVGALAAYLCSDLSGFITGAILDINGGLLMR